MTGTLTMLCLFHNRRGRNFATLLLLKKINLLSYRMFFASKKNGRKKCDH